MILNYGPYFDSIVHVDYSKRSGKTLVNETYLGDIGLLSEMELRLGLTRALPSEETREVDYYTVLHEYLVSNEESFISQSFKIDPLNVSKELLRWRDELILCGWNKESNGSNKLQLISQIETLLPEQSSVKMGYGDRWQDILAEDKATLDGIQVIVHFPERHIAPHIRKLFNQLSHVNSSVEYVDYSSPKSTLKGSDLYLLQMAFINGEQKVNLKGDGSVKALQFNNYIEAVEWCCSAHRSLDSVVINKNNKQLDDFQLSVSGSTSGCKLTRVNPEVSQLFKLGCSLLMEPLDIYKLLAYLQVDVNPIPKSLRKALIKVVTDTGGVLNEEWNEAIEYYLEQKDDDGNNNRQKKEKRLILLPIGGREKNNSVSIERVKEFVSALGNWASQRKALLRSSDKSATNNELILSQLGALVDFCSSLNKLAINSNDKIIPNDLFQRWIRSVYRAKSYPYSKPELGSLSIVPSPANVPDSVSNSIWLDCFVDYTEANPIAFMTSEEVNHIANNGAYPWIYTDRIAAQMFAEEMAVLQSTESLTLVLSNKLAGKVLAKHPLVTKITQILTGESQDKLYANPQYPEDIEWKKIEKQDLPKPVTYVELTDVSLTPRPKESYSSLDALIQYPIDYVFNYMLGLRDNSTQSIADLNRTIGNVAHLVIETFVEKYKSSEQVLADLNASYDNIFNEAVTKVGAILLLKENTIETSRVRAILRDSTRKLFQFIRANSLTIIGCEISYLCKTNLGFELDAKIDFVCEDSMGRAVLFDLKWTTSRTKYRKLLEEGKALQLSVYQYAVENQSKTKDVAAKAYYLLSFGDVVSNDFSSDNETVKDELISKTWNSYKYRWAQLKSGRIEVAEDTEIDELDYFIETGDEGLWPLNTRRESGRTRKDPNYYSNYNTLKGGLK